jgi:hypothetical protein
MDVDQEEEAPLTTQKPKKRSKLTDGHKKTAKRSKVGKP